MSPVELEQYLHQQIPLSRAMAVSVISVALDGVVLQAPIRPNINHHDSVFGGSASALAILAAWSLLHVRLRSEGLNCQLVIQRNSMVYLKPVLGEFTARSFLPESSDWQRFVHIILRNRMARIRVDSELVYLGQIAGQFSGDFVGQQKSTTTPKHPVV